METGIRLESHSHDAVLRVERPRVSRLIQTGGGRPVDIPHVQERMPRRQSGGVGGQIYKALQLPDVGHTPVVWPLGGFVEFVNQAEGFLPGKRASGGKGVQAPDQTGEGIPHSCTGDREPGVGGRCVFLGKTDGPEEGGLLFLSAGCGRRPGERASPGRGSGGRLQRPSNSP